MDFEKKTIMEESELLIEKLREHPMLAKLVDYALGLGIIFLVHPCSNEMAAKDRSSWHFFDFSAQGGRCFIFIPFDIKNKVVIADSTARQIFCLAHEISHFRLKDILVYRQIADQCQIWRERVVKSGDDVCLLKELLVDIEAIRILQEICQAVIRSHGWRVTLLQLWRQCSACLRAINRGVCPCRQVVGNVMNGLAKIIKLTEISCQMEKTKNQP